MKKKLAIAALLSTLLAPAAYAEDPIKIGFIAELSGPPAVLGTDQYDGEEILRRVSTPFKDHADSYHAECPMS